MLRHGHSSHTVNKSVIKPIPKKQKSLVDSNNYRAISKNSVISKIIDNVVLILIGDSLSTSCYQFAYKKNFSTSLCSFLVSETIQYYRSRGSNVYMLSLDATKAFDKVQYSKLFNLLIERDICPLIIRLLISIYSVSSAIVSWNNVKSNSFEINNGVKQGAIISPPLFGLYINPLLMKLQQCKQGCYMGNICANAFTYADDIVILAPTCTALNSLIKICENYAKEYKVCFNPDKCTLLIYANDDFYFNNVNILIGGVRVKNVKSESHLGHIFRSSYNIIDIQSIIKDIKVRTNVILSQFRCLNWQAKVKLFLSQCSALYGCPLWNLDDPNIELLCTAWKVCCRKILGIMPDSRSMILHQVMSTLPIKDMIMNRQISFVLSGINHENQMIASFFRNSLVSNSSYVVKNINCILKYLNLGYENLFIDTNKSKVRSLFYKKMGHPDWRISIIKELLDLREGLSFCEFEHDSDIKDKLSKADINKLLDHVTRSRDDP